ncbi:agrin-like [Anneissia japonica]|uniref:agrin-like n=1 Tax=Anneissia japonica TaxID=1529436 RepID=UPI001425805A|nr:agrin-like [Anneissia japonica]
MFGLLWLLQFFTGGTLEIGSKMKSSKRTSVLHIFVYMLAFTWIIGGSNADKENCKICPAASKQTDQVCGSDGITYPSKCSLKRKACRKDIELEIAYVGECFNTVTVNNSPAHTDATTVTPQHTTSSVGFNTESLPIDLEDAGLPVNCKICPRPSIVSQRVCGSDGKTYRSKCLLKKRACKTLKEIVMLYKGRCKLSARPTPESTSEPSAVTSELTKTRPTHRLLPLQRPRPTRGSYEAGIRRNQGTTQATAKLPNEIESRLTPKIVGPDGSDSDEFGDDCEECPQPTVNDFVCGTDGTTYSSACLLRKLSCINGIRLIIAHRGRCYNDTVQLPTPNKIVGPNGIPLGRLDTRNNTCHKKCQLPTKRDKVCGSDGLTYPSKCILKRSACLSNTDISVVHKGRCKTIPVTKENRISEEDNDDNSVEDGAEPSNLPSVNAIAETYRNGEDDSTEDDKDSEEVHPVGVVTPNKKKKKNNKKPPSDNHTLTPINRLTTESTSPVTLNNSTGVSTSNTPVTQDEQTTDNQHGLSTPLPTFTPVGLQQGTDSVMETPTLVTNTPTTVDLTTKLLSTKLFCGGKCPKPTRNDKVCGSDGMTYSSACSLKKKSCSFGTDVVVDYKGKCKKPAKKLQEHITLRSTTYQPTPTKTTHESEQTPTNPGTGDRKLSQNSEFRRMSHTTSYPPTPTPTNEYGQTPTNVVTSGKIPSKKSQFHTTHTTNPPTPMKTEESKQSINDATSDKPTVDETVSLLTTASSERISTEKDSISEFHSSNELPESPQEMVGEEKPTEVTFSPNSECPNSTYCITSNSRSEIPEETPTPTETDMLSETLNRLNRLARDLTQSLSNILNELAFLKSQIQDSQQKPNMDDCLLDCSTMFKPVCGTDRVSYTSECALNKFKCVQNDMDLSIAHDGKCQSDK